MYKTFADMEKESRGPGSEEKKLKKKKMDNTIFIVVNGLHGGRRGRSL